MSRKKLLSPRQAECLRRVRALQSTDEIARDLQISTGTVNSYIREAIVSLGARDRRHAALLFEDVERGATDFGTGSRDVLRDPIDRLAPPISNVGDTPQSIVRDAVGEELPFEKDTRFAQILREIMDGSRPEGWSMVTRSALVLAAVVTIGMATLLMSASLGILYSIAAGIKSAAG
jgi:DNA-binding CsgD family transcriptional regulator